MHPENNISSKITCEYCIEEIEVDALQAHMLIACEAIGRNESGYVEKLSKSEDYKGEENENNSQYRNREQRNRKKTKRWEEYSQNSQNKTKKNRSEIERGIDMRLTKEII